MNRPPLDPALSRALESLPGVPTPYESESLRLARSIPNAETEATILSGGGLSHRTESIEGYGGARIDLSLLQREDSQLDGPMIVYMHGGGMILGDRFVGLTLLVPYVKEFDALVVSVEYRLAPENPYPVPVEDCYAALEWVASARSGIPAARPLFVAGVSAGGGLAAAVAMLARDRRGPQLAGQWLICPMLDDRNDSVSARQFAEGAIWSAESNRFGWHCYLGSAVGTAEVSSYAAPGRCDDLAGLPPTFLDVGAAEVFRDEVVSFASRLWTAGNDAELHVWSGAFHAFFGIAPEALVSQQAYQAQSSWFRRQLCKT